MIYIKSQSEIDRMREGGHILAQILYELKKQIRAGIKTKDLENFAVDLIYRKGAKPSFKGYKGFPGSICVSVNEEVVHGIPGNRILKNGDIVDIDIGIKYKNLFTDISETVPVGQISKKAKELLDVTKKSLYIGIDQVRPNNHLGDIGFAIQKFAESNGFSVVRDLVGHGVGRKVHEDPQVPNYGNRGEGEKLKRGMTFAIEPMLNVGDYKVHTKDDNWTFVTSDGSLSAHFEHTIVVTKDGYEILTL